MARHQREGLVVGVFGEGVQGVVEAPQRKGVVLRFEWSPIVRVRIEGGEPRDWLVVGLFADEDRWRRECVMLQLVLVDDPSELPSRDGDSHGHDHGSLPASGGPTRPRRV